MNTTDIIASYDNNAEAYANHRLGEESGPQLQTFFQALKPASKVLDVGCAAGRDTNTIKKAGFQVVGVDLSQKLLDIAKKTYPELSFVLSDMRQLPFESSMFDGIWAAAVLHHLERPDMLPTLTEWHRVLKRGGTLFVSTKMGSGQLKTQEAMVGGWQREFNLLNPEELDDLLAKSGFSKISLEQAESKNRPGLIWLMAFYQKR